MVRNYYSIFNIVFSPNKKKKKKDRENKLTENEKKKKKNLCAIFEIIFDYLTVRSVKILAPCIKLNSFGLKSF